MYMLPALVFASQLSAFLQFITTDSLSELKNRESYKSAHFLLNFLNELMKSDKMRGLSTILSLFRKLLNKFSMS